MFPPVMLVVNVSSVGVLWFGGHRVDSGEMQVGALTAFLAYLMQILMSVMMATFMLMMVPRAAVCADRITRGARHRDLRGAARRPGARARTLRGELELDDVSSPIPAPTSRSCTTSRCTADAGQTLAIIGSTGAGKSTLVNLVPRLFDATGGGVRVDGVDVRDSTPRLLWSRIGLVPQKAFLFTGTVAQQPPLRQARRHRRGDVGGARDRPGTRLRRGACPSGLDAADRPGRHQRLGRPAAAAGDRARVVRRPEIYLFDDSFSALDLATDARLRAALKPVTREATVVIVAQRVSTIRDADRIVVLEDGAVVGNGTHDGAAGRQRDLPGDRRVPAERGGGGMSHEPQSPTPERPAVAKTGRAPLKETERIRAGGAGPGRGPFGGGMVGAEGDGLRAVGQAPGPHGCAPERIKAIASWWPSPSLRSR